VWVGAYLMTTGLGKRLSMWLLADMVGGATLTAEVVGCLVEEALLGVVGPEGDTGVNVLDESESCDLQQLGLVESNPNLVLCHVISTRGERSGISVLRTSSS
jgi:hypothetical protein